MDSDRPGGGRVLSAEGCGAVGGLTGGMRRWGRGQADRMAGQAGYVYGEMLTATFAPGAGFVLGTRVTRA